MPSANDGARESAVSFKAFLLNKFLNIKDRYLIFRKRRHEIIKFQDPRRKKIYETVELTPEQKKQIDELYGTYYGGKIPYTWHRNFTAFTGKFDVTYFPELLYIPEFEYFKNFNDNYRTTFADKNLLPLIAAGVGIRMPKTIFSAVNGILRDTNYNIISEDEARKLLSDNIYFLPSLLLTVVVAGVAFFSFKFSCGKRF